MFLATGALFSKGRSRIVITLTNPNHFARTAELLAVAPTTVPGAKSYGKLALLHVEC